MCHNRANKQHVPVTCMGYKLETGRYMKVNTLPLFEEGHEFHTSQ